MPSILWMIYILRVINNVIDTRAGTRTQLQRCLHLSVTRKMLLLNPDKATSGPVSDYDDQNVN